MTLMNDYGKALFMLTEERGTTENVLKEITLLDKVFSENPDYVKLLDTPAISKAEKLVLIDEAFKDFDEDLKSLVKILCEKHSTNAFLNVKKCFSALYDTSRGIEHVEAVTAVPMTSAQLTKMSEKLSAKSGKKIIIKNTVSPEILGGVKLRYSGVQLDGSLKTRLEKFEASLKNTVI